MTQSPREERPPVHLDQSLEGLLFAAPRVVGAPPPFACRPLAARSAERHTVLGGFSGGIGLQSLEEFRLALQDLAGQEAGKIFLDFSAATLSRTAIGVLVAFAAAMHGNNKRLYLYRPSAQVRAELKKIDLAAFFPVLESPDDVIASLEM